MKERNPKTKGIRLIGKNNYGQYLRSQFISFFSTSKNYPLIGLCILSFGLYWHKHGLNSTLRGFMVLANGLTVMALLTEVLATFSNRELKRNRLATYVLTIATITTINWISNDKMALYWSFASGLIFTVPALIFLLVKRIKIWKNL